MFSQQYSLYLINDTMCLCVLNTTKYLYPLLAIAKAKKDLKQKDLVKERKVNYCKILLQSKLNHAKYNAHLFDVESSAAVYNKRINL